MKENPIMITPFFLMSLLFLGGEDSVIEVCQGRNWAIEVEKHCNRRSARGAQKIKIERGSENTSAAQKVFEIRSQQGGACEFPV